MKKHNVGLLMVVLTVFFLIGLAVGCGGEEVGEDSATVGGACSSDRDCKEVCLTGSDWPGGMCSLRCDSDDDCPYGSHCIDTERGVCMMACRSDDDCPGGYECDDEDRRGHSGKIHVCEGD